MQKLLSEVEFIRKSDCPVLIIGETGTGKEIVADYIHSNSLRADRNFIKVSLSSLPDSLIESELFGHEKGAYTGADRARSGFFESANNATIFLDDIDDFPFHLQSKLLRVIENNQVIRIGTNTPVYTDARIIASSKVELNRLVDKGSFRSDLFYRLSVFRLYIPPLRERKDDIPSLLNHFLNVEKTSTNGFIDITKLNLVSLFDYDWLGNVRELRNFAEKLSLYPVEEIYSNFERIFEAFSAGNFRHSVLEPESQQQVQAKPEVKKRRLDESVAEYEKQLICNTLKQSFGNVNLAARILGVLPSTLRYKIKQYKINSKDFKNII